MSTLHRMQISRYRKEIGQGLRKMAYLSSRCLFPDPLIQGYPQKVFRSCGKKNCRCMKDPKNRHGPYKVISITKEGKQRQIPLKKDEGSLWDLACHYQHQMNQLYEFLRKAAEIRKLVLEVLEKRLVPFPNR